jgi:hypothetical protein
MKARKSISSDGANIIIFVVGLLVLSGKVSNISAISRISRTVAVWVKPTESFTLRIIHLFQQQ